MFVAALLGLASAVASEFIPTPCAEGLPSGAVCGIIAVPEDRSKAGGRNIDLSIVILKTAKPARLPPLFDIDGGPGLPTFKNAEFYASNAVSKDRDVVMIDQRGTGRSNGLACPELSAVPPTEPMLPEAMVADCLQSLSARADLRFYGTADAVEDLEQVRRTLSYGKIDLLGLSYGTTVALAYMRDYPENVRAAVLMGTAPPQTMAPKDHAVAAQRALQAVIEDCASKPACKARFPDFRQAIEAARARAPSPELLMERIRTRMYAPASRAELPLAIELAARGDSSRLFGSNQGGPPNLTAFGMFLSVTCGESFPLMDYEAAARSARATPFGEYRLRVQRAACANWPKVRLSPNHLDLPTTTDASVLFISGAMDPVTPPDWADGVAKVMKQARHVIIPAGGHIPDGLANLETCLDPMMIKFLDQGDLASLDTSCVASMTPPDYLVE